VNLAIQLENPAIDSTRSAADSVVHVYIPALESRQQAQAVTASQFNGLASIDWNIVTLASQKKTYIYIYEKP